MLSGEGLGFRVDGLCATVASQKVQGLGLSMLSAYAWRDVRRSSCLALLSGVWVAAGVTCSVSMSSIRFGQGQKVLCVAWPGCVWGLVNACLAV